MPFEQMIIARTKQWIDEYDESNRPRLADGVTLTMRNRNDYFGYFYNRSRMNSQWRPWMGKGMVTYPIVGRSIRAKTATAVSTKVQTEIEAVRSVPERDAAADLARNIVKYCREHHWTKQTEAIIAELCQIHRFAFIYNTYQTTGGVIVEVPQTERKAVKSGDTLYVCDNCGFQFGPEDLGIPDIADQFKDKDIAQSETAEIELQEPKQLAGVSDQVEAEYTEPEYQAQPELDEESEEILQHTAGLTCPDCSTNTLIMQNRAKHEVIDALTGGNKRVDCGYMDVRIESPLLIRFDSYKCLGFTYKKADWFNYHPLVPAYEVLAMAPHAVEFIATGENKWSESARLHFELNNNTSSSSGFSYRGKSYRLDELVEINCWWIAPHACFGWRSPDQYTLPIYDINEAGECIETDKAAFTIETGETVEDAYKRQFGSSFNGALLVMYGDHIIGIGNEHFTEHWTGIPWKVDAQSAFPQGEENLLKLQDAATNVLGMVYSHTRRRALSTLVADPLGGFTEDAVQNAGQPGEIIYRKSQAPEVQDQDWRKYLGYLEPGELSIAIFNFIQLIIDIAKEESGIFNETVGNVQGGRKETLGAREIALNQSLGLMTPTQQAKAIALREEEYLWLELWQKYAPDEAYALIKGTFEEEWKPQDVESFKALDIRRELFIFIVENTDVPRSQGELEQRFLLAVQSGLFLEPNPLPLQIRAHIIRSVLGIDFDIQNYSAYKRLAARRYEVIKQELAALSPNEAFTIVADAQGFPMRTLRPEIIASISQDVRTAVRGTDEHLVFVEFYTDQINGLAGAHEPDEVLIAACEKQIDAHRAMLAANTVQAMAVQGIAEGAGPQASAANAPVQPVKPNTNPAQ